MTRIDTLSTSRTLQWFVLSRDGCWNGAWGIKLLPNSALAGSTVAERHVTLQGEMEPRGWCPTPSAPILAGLPQRHSAPWGLLRVRSLGNWEWRLKPATSRAAPFPGCLEMVCFMPQPSIQWGQCSLTYAGKTGATRRIHLQELIALAHLASVTWSFSFPLPDSEGRLKAKVLGKKLRAKRQHPERLLREPLAFCEVLSSLVLPG